MKALLLAAEEGGDPLSEVFNHLVPHEYGWAPHWQIGAFDLTISNAVLNIWLAAGAVMLLYWLAVNKPRVIPKGIQNFMEVTTDFLKENLVYQVMNPRDGRVWGPFIVALFMFIFFMNALGLIPWIGFTPTSNIFVTGALSVAVYLLAVTVGMAQHGVGTFWKKTLIPEGVPKPMLALMVPIEVISQLAQPFSLAVRLFANMLADHVILLIFVGFILLIGTGAFLAGLISAPFLLVFEVVFYFFAIFVAFIQAVIFAFLSALYINNGLHPGH